MARTWRGAWSEAEADWVAAEEPLEIRVDHEPLATLMRTPGDDMALALGFLFGEGVIDSIDEVGAVATCARSATAQDEPQNVVDVLLVPGVPRRGRDRRHGAAISSCGVCGKRTIDEALRSSAPPPCRDSHRTSPVGLDPRLLAALPDRLRGGQPLFERSGAIHAAGLFELGDVPEGRLLWVREDVGRHNAVDKVVGLALRERRPPCTHAALVVSGRVSFEIVQKAHRAGVAAIVAVSGVSSLAVEFAMRTEVPLLGFVRDGRLRVYAGNARLDPGTSAGKPAS